MYRIVNKQIITQTVKRVEVQAPDLARSFKPGQFAVVAATSLSKRLLMTPVDVDPSRGTVSFVFKETEPSFQLLGSLRIGDEVYSVSGPFGQRYAPQKSGTVLCVAHDQWVSHLVFICKALKDAGNKVVGIIDFEDKKEVILEAKMRRECQRLTVLTKDSNVYKKKESIFDLLPKAAASESVNEVIACGSLDFLKNVKQAVSDEIQLQFVLTPVLLSGANVFDTTSIDISKNRYYPCFSQNIFSAKEVDLAQFVKEQNAWEEYQWQSSQSAQGRPLGASRIFPRLLSGLIKPRP